MNYAFYWFDEKLRTSIRCYEMKVHSITLSEAVGEHVKTGEK